MTKGILRTKLNLLMKWLYHWNKEWSDDAHKVVQVIHLRPTMTNEEGVEMVGKIFKLTLIAEGFYHALKEKNPTNNYEGLAKVFNEALQSEKHHIIDRKLQATDTYLLSNTEVYLKQPNFGKAIVFEWVDHLFAVKNYTYSELEERTLDDFVELNPIMKMFSPEQAKQLEAKFGKEWWKFIQ